MTDRSPLLRALKSVAEATPGKTALLDHTGAQLSYAGLWDKVCAKASELKSEGLLPGQRRTLRAHNDSETVITYLGTHLAGGINMVVDPKWTPDHVNSLEKLTAELPLARTDIADIMFTSGTTGTPKIVPLTHGNIFGSATNINSFIGNTADDVELIGLPLCHSFALGRLRCSLINGATVVLSPGFSNLKMVFDLMERYGVTGFGMVPAVFAYIKRFSGNRIARFAPQLRYIEIGSAAMPQADKELLAEIFPDTRICMHYGMTEASRMTFVEFHSMAGKLQSVGVPASAEVDIRIADDQGNFLTAGNEGEICVKGNMVTPGYLGTHSTDCFTQGYFHTGDFGHIDSEGYLYLAARKKEMINVGGKKVNPIEIEEALENIGVGESMCVAMPDPDGILGEVPKVLIVNGTFKLSPEEILGKLRQTLENYKMPRIIEVVKSIPKTDSGKKIRTGHNV